MRAKDLKTQGLEQILAINAVFWDQAPDLVSRGYRIQAYLAPGEKAYHVTFSKPGESQHLIAIERKSETTTPARIEMYSIFQTLATHSDIDILRIPLLPFGTKDDASQNSTIRMSRPNPKIQWTLEIDGTPLVGSKKKALKLEPLGAVLDTATFAKATTADLVISSQAKEYFRARLRRTEWVAQELAQKNTNLRSYCLDKGLQYSKVYRILQRGDDAPEIKAQLARIAKRKVAEMWPEIDWAEP